MPQGLKVEIYLTPSHGEHRASKWKNQEKRKKIKNLYVLCVSVARKPETCNLQPATLNLQLSRVFHGGSSEVGCCLSRVRCLLFLAFWILAGAARAAGADADANPYRAIATHNAFGLTPPPETARPDAAPPPPDIVLNGIMSVFDRNFALFKLRAAGEKSRLLAEGQSDGEIELLSVDGKAGTIRIKNQGIVQTVALAKPPAPVSALSGAPATTPSIAGAAPASAANNGAVPVENISPPQSENIPAQGAPIFLGGRVVAGADNPGSSGNNAPSAGNSGPQNSGGSNPAANPPDPWWIIGSRNMEASRIATAALVESGQADPYPLTPFTPPGTPAALIGSGQLYFVQTVMAK